MLIIVDRGINMFNIIICMFLQVFRSIGYRSVAIDNDIPFDEKKGVISCESKDGHVAGLPGINSSEIS